MGWIVDPDLCQAEMPVEGTGTASEGSAFTSGEGSGRGVPNPGIRPLSVRLPDQVRTGPART